MHRLGVKSEEQHHRIKCLSVIGINLPFTFGHKMDQHPYRSVVLIKI